MNLDCEFMARQPVSAIFPADCFLPQIRFTVAPKAEDVRPVSILRQVGDVTCFSVEGIGMWAHMGPWFGGSVG